MPMKNRLNQILLTALIITVVLYAFFVLIWLDIIPRPFYDPADPFRFLPLWAFLGIGFHSVPCFFLQLLVCRMTKKTRARLIPLFLLAGAVVWFTVGFFTNRGLDSLGWGILLLLCIAPAVGYALAWGVYSTLRALGKET